jgi:hypothetical protein
VKVTALRAKMSADATQGRQTQFDKAMYTGMQKDEVKGEYHTVPFKQYISH